MDRLKAAARFAAKHPGLIVGLLVSGFLIGGATAVDDDGLFGQVPAAWVQALGSVAAIIAATVIAGEESRRAATAKDKADLARLLIVEAISRQCVEAISKSDQIIELAADDQVAATEHYFSPENWISITTALEQIQLSDLPSARVAVSIINQRRTGHFYRQHYEDWWAVRLRKIRNEEEPDAPVETQRNAFYDCKVAQQFKLNALGELLATTSFNCGLIHAEIVDEVRKAKERLGH